MKKKYFLIIILATLSLNIAIAQANLKTVKKLAKKCSKGNVKACEELKSIAIKNMNHSAQKAAVENITAQSILVDIAKNNSNSSDVRIAAIKKITDQSILVDIAKNDKKTGVRVAAIKKLTNQNILTEIVSNDRDWSIRAAAAEKITDQNILTGIVKNEKVWRVALPAVRKITNQKFLIDIVKSSKHKEIQIIALNKLDEDDFYDEIIDIIDKNKDEFNNLSKLGALKVIQNDEIWKNFNNNFTIDIKIHNNEKVYYWDQFKQAKIGTWRRLIYHIIIKTDDKTKKFIYEGQKELLQESVQKINKLHLPYININEICEYLLSPLSKDDLLTVSKESDVFFLRNAAQQLLIN